MPDIDRRWVIRVPPEPYLRFDRNDYSLDPRLVGRRVEVRVGQREVIAVVLDTRRARVPAPRAASPAHRTITAPEHARALRAARAAPPGRELEVESAAARAL